MENLVENVKTSIKYWWVSLVIGIFAIILGVIAIVTPEATLLTLSFIFGWGILLSGLMMICFALSNRKAITGWGWSLASGIIDFVIGLFLVISPMTSLVVLITFVGLAVLFQSIWAIGESIELQAVGSKRWGWLLLLSILGIVLSFLLILNPMFAATFIVVLFSIAMIIYGIFRISYALEIRRFGSDIKSLKEHLNSFRKNR